MSRIVEIPPQSHLANFQILRYPARVTEDFSFLDPLNALPGIRAAWVERIPNVDVHGTRDEAMRQLRPTHERIARSFGGPDARWWRAEQVHGHDVAVVPDAPETIAGDGLPVVPGVDGLITHTPGVLLSIYVADCGAIWLADSETHAIGLLHSGKKGTQDNILAQAVNMMTDRFGSEPRNLIAVLSPCIRVPDYDVAFADEIARQARRCGVREFVDCGLNTAADLQRFYSYRKEQGQTGRMMAMMIRDPQP